MPVKPKPATFKSGPNNVAAQLHLPEGFQETSAYPAVVIVTPGSSVKEQIGANYGRRLARSGYVALVF